MKKIYIESLGCPKNLVDSELISYRLPKNKYTITDNPERADTILVNTCGFIRDAKEESIEYILKFSRMPGKEVVAFGCMVNLYKEELLRSIPGVTFYSIDEFFNKYLRLQYDRGLDYSGLNALTPKSYSYVKISDGCSRRCSFCTIPIIKGKLFSRPIKNIILEIKKKFETGIREYNLVAQDTNAFGRDIGEFLSGLLDEIEKIHLDFKARLLYLYPDKKLIRLAKQIQESEKMINYLDIPLQHISPRVLKLMKRPDDRKFYYGLFNSIKKIDPEFILRSTFIIGFPGETEEDFQDLLKFLKDVKFNWAGFFPYSDEKEAESSKLAGKVDKRTIARRMEKVISVQKEITSQWLESRVGNDYDVVVDEILKEDGCILARSYAEAPEIDGSIIIKYNQKVKVGDRLKVKIINALDYDLEAEIC